MSQFDYITNFISGQNSAKMSIKKPITTGGASGINGADFAGEMDFLAAQGVENVDIDINSVGGSIVEGFAIFEAIKNSTMNTTTRVVGIAASMAGIISQAGDKRVIVDYGIFHAHGPQVPEGAKVEEDLVNKMLGSLKIMISAKANVSEAEVSEMLSKETVLTALEAKQKGFFDEIETTRGLKPALKASADLEAIYLIANEFITNTNKMDKISKLLSLENATEETIIDSVKGLQAKADELEAKSTELEAKAGELETLTNELETVKGENEEAKVKVEDLTNTVELLKTQAAEDLIENAIKSGKISEDKKDSWISQAKNDIENTKVLLDSVKGVVTAANLKNEIENTKEVENRKEWDFQKWGQEDPKGLEAMQTENPEAFNKLFNEYVEN